MELNVFTNNPSKVYTATVNGIFYTRAQYVMGAVSKIKIS